MTAHSDIELLEIQAEGSFDPAGRLAGRYGLTIACSADRQALWIGAAVPDAVAAELTAAFDGAARPRDPAEPPPALERCRRILETAGRSVQRKAGPSFVFPDGAQFSSELRIERSDRARGDAVRSGNPGNWHPVEWDELLDGQLGPWTMAVDGALVASICHTPGPVTARAAECGVWTRPELRGRGYAAATAAAWAEILRPSGRHLFYSTDADNRSSQRVARRLGLRSVGWTWRLAPAPDPDAASLHPLSALRSGRAAASITAG